MFPALYFQNLCHAISYITPQVKLCKALTNLFCSQGHGLAVLAMPPPAGTGCFSSPCSPRQGRRPCPRRRGRSSTRLSCCPALQRDHRLPAQPLPTAAPGQSEQARHRSCTTGIFMSEASHRSIWADQSRTDLVTNCHA